MSATQSWLGRLATKRRSTRSAGRIPTSAGMVVRRLRARERPERLIWRMRRSVRQREMQIPSRLSWRQTFRGPYTWRLCAYTRSISILSSASRMVRCCIGHAASLSQLTACEGWTVHDITAHLAAGSGEMADLIENHLAGGQQRATRSFEERERPYREMDDVALRERLFEQVARSINARQRLAELPDDEVLFTGRNMRPAEFAMHSRSERALQRWDTVDLDIRWGEIFGLLGPNGAGKTTTVEILEPRGGHHPSAGVPVGDLHHVQQQHSVLAHLDRPDLPVRAFMLGMQSGFIGTSFSCG